MDRVGHGQALRGRRGAGAEGGFECQGVAIIQRPNRVGDWHEELVQGGVADTGLELNAGHPQDPRTHARRVRGCLAEQRGLPHPGLADNDQRPAGDR